MRRVDKRRIWVMWFTLWSCSLSANSTESVSLVWAEQQYAMALATTDRHAKRLLLEHLKATLSPRETLWFRVRGSLYALAQEERG